MAALGSPALADKVRADKLFDDGRRYLAGHEYALACTAFEQSQQADPAIGTQLNIALCYEQWGEAHVVAAYHAYVEAERLAKMKFDDRAKAAHRKVEELYVKLPHLTVTIPETADANAVFLMDGKDAERATLTGDMIVEAGEHAIEVRVLGAPPKTQRVNVHLGAHETLVLDVPVGIAEPRAATTRKKGRFYAGIGLAATGGVALGVASYVAVVARSDYNDAIASCPSSTCTTHGAYNATQDAISHANTASIIGGVGVAAAAVGVYLILTSRGEVAAAPMVGNGTVGLAIGGRL
jgi:hypothetical protein